MSTLLALDHFGVTYPRQHAPSLQDVTLTLHAGEKLALIGESGSGKSTLALAIAGLLPPHSQIHGDLYWPGFGRAALPGADFGMVFQDPGSSLNPLLRIGEQVAEAAQRHLGLDWHTATYRALDLLQQVKIPQPEAVLRAFPHQLSGGQRQRIALAAAIAAHPRLLIADEATSALDMIVQAEVATLIDQLVAEENMALLFITHDIGLAAQLADRIAVFHQTRMVESAPTPELLACPASPYTQHLLATHIELDAPPRIARGLP